MMQAMPATLSLRQAIAGALKFGEAVDPVLLALAVLGDYFGWGVLDEGFAGELAGDFFDLGFDFGYFSVEAFFLRGGIDDAFQREVDDSDIRRTGCMALRSGFAEGEGLRMQQDGEDRGLVFDPIRCRGNLPRQAFVAGDAVGRTDVSGL